MQEDCNFKQGAQLSKQYQRITQFTKNMADRKTNLVGAYSSKVRAQFQGHFGGQDELTPHPDIQLIEDTLRPHKIRHEFFTDPDRQHWFCEKGRLTRAGWKVRWKGSHLSRFIK